MHLLSFEVFVISPGQDQVLPSGHKRAAITDTWRPQSRSVTEISSIQLETNIGQCPRMSSFPKKYPAAHRGHRAVALCHPVWAL